LSLDQDASSKLDLARAYIEMGDNDGAKPLLEEVLSEGDDEQVREANELIGNIR
jgi:pilus assembly protein FimV